MKKALGGMIEISIAAILFGLIPIIVKLSTIDSYSLSLGRITFAALFLGIWIYFSRTELNSIKKAKIRFLFFGILHALTIICYFIALKLIPAAIAVLLIYAGAIYLVILSAIFLKEKIENITWVSLIISFIGLFLLFYTPNLTSNFWGYFAGFSAGLLMSIVFLMGKILSKSYDQMSMTFFQNMIALPLMLPLLFILKFEPSTTNILTLIFLGIFCTAIPFLLLYSGMKKVKGQKVGILLLLEIVIPIILAFILFKEIPAPIEIIGGILIIIGFILLIMFHKE